MRDAEAVNTVRSQGGHFNRRQGPHCSSWPDTGTSGNRTGAGVGVGGSRPCPPVSRRRRRAETRGAGWEQTGALNGVEQRLSALNGIQLHPPRPAHSRFRRSESVQRPVSQGVLRDFAHQSTALYVPWQGSVRRSRR